MASVNLTHVGFAPAENPEVAYAVVIPYASTDRSNYITQNIAMKDIVRTSLDTYFELKEQRAKTNVSETTDQKIDRRFEKEKEKEKEKETNEK